MRSRTANELSQRTKVLLTAIQREYDENESIKTKAPNKPQQSSTSNKENDEESEKSREKKEKRVKRKSWMPTISFAQPNGSEPKAQKAVKASETMTNGNGSYPDAIASTSGLTNKPIAQRKMSMDMPLLD